MAINFNLNKALGNKALPLVTLVIFSLLGIFIYLATNGKHNKLPVGIETNIPYIDTLNKTDTVGTIKDNHIDKSKNIEVKDNHGNMHIKM